MVVVGGGGGEGWGSHQHAGEHFNIYSSSKFLSSAQVSTGLLLAWIQGENRQG